MRTKKLLVLFAIAGLSACASRPELVVVPCPPPPQPPADLMQPPARSDFGPVYEKLRNSVERLEIWLKPSETPTSPPPN